MFWNIIQNMFLWFEWNINVWKIKYAKRSNIILQKKAVHIFWNIEICPVCKHVGWICKEKSESCTGMFGVSGKLVVYFRFYWPGQERWIWHAWEKVNRAWLKSAQMLQFTPCVTAAQGAKNTLAAWGESSTEFCNSCVQDIRFTIL